MTKIRKSSYDIDLSYFIFQMSNIGDEQDTPSINIHLPTVCITIHILFFSCASNYFIQFKFLTKIKL